MRHLLNKLFGKSPVPVDIPDRLWVISQAHIGHLPEMSVEQTTEFLDDAARQASKDNQTLFIPVINGVPNCPMFSTVS